MFAVDLSQIPSCTRFGRMLQRNRWNRQGITQKNVNLLVFVVAGGAIFNIEDVSYSVKTGDVLIIPAGTPYSADTDDMCDYYFFHFTGDIERTDSLTAYPIMKRDFSFDIPLVTQRRIVIMEKTEAAEDYSKVHSCINACTDLHASATYSGRLAIDTELSKLLLLLAEILERQHFTLVYPMVLVQMLEYIRKNLTKSITSSELCRYCGVSASYAARLFKKHLQTTVTQYITDQKLAYACELMCNTGMNVSQIASYLGFCDVFYFSKCFKEKFGKSPMQMIPRE